MKIDTTIKAVTAPRSKDAKSTKGQMLASAADPASVSDDVRLTSTSGKLRQFETELADVDVADSGKVEAVRQAIADGSFSVDEEVVAEGLIQESVDNITQQARR
ncbi:MAG: flagellar biosynthesis anti-sigma factor FlgM [Thiobacillaceae bacterium]|nr:flagellar biosynthesis anti-sigma factor FlgM [Hydrogenophilales bacterium]MBP9915954.1 flagellar biosynthesis anti-sigma factor FlgM [Thiobacillaceae bacterium]